jgi:hypothetical protein
MKTRLMTVHKVEPPTAQQVQARCAEMKRLQVEGKLQNLPALCSAPLSPPRRAPAGKRQIGA